MTTSQADPVAVVGIAAIMPQAPTAETFWTNLKKGIYSITDVPPERWDPAVYYDPDRSAVDKTYSRIGGWVREFEWNPIAWHLPIPPKVAEQMDEGQRWAVSAARAALTDAGYPEWSVNGDRVAVIFGNAIGGEKHYQSSMRIRLPEMLLRLQQSPTLRALAPEVQQRIVDEARSLYRENVFGITEDTMPGELSNVMAGRVANLFNLRGPNFTTDAACASALAAIDNAVMGLRERRFDAAVCGGVDRNMGVDAFVKFCKIGALSATGTRPFDAGADGFVMGEGAAVFVLKRLEDAERDGDRIYATILGIAGSSDGKGKGITAPNPVGQQLAVARAWADSGEDMGTVSAIEAHGTSTRVGDAAELTSLSEVFGSAGLAPRSVALGSVKSNIGHLKAAAGAAGLFKMVRSLHEKVLVPSLSFNDPNPGVDWNTSVFAVNTALREWPEPAGGIRRGGVSAFGFGGTNYHVVVEEHVPGRHRPRPRVHASAEVPQATIGAGSYSDAANSTDTPHATPIILDVAPSAKTKAPLRGALVLGAADDTEMLSRLTTVRNAARAGETPPRVAPDRSVSQAAVRVGVDFGSAAELAGKLDKVIMGLQTGNAAVLRMMRQQGAFVGRGPAPKVAFLYTGQGSQYVNMLRGLAAAEPVVGQTFAEADRVMAPLLGQPLTDYIFVDPADEAAVAAAGRRLMQTEITQPAVLAADLALTRLLAAYGVAPDMVMGHSLGEYGALVAAGALSFEAALEAVSARGREMAHLSVDDNGAMAAVFGPLETIQRMVDEADGYAVVANINSYSQAVVGGATAAVERLIERFTEAGLTASRIPVSHAFHTSIVAPASVPFGEALRRLDVRPPTLPIVANVTGEFYPADASSETMLDYARRQIASPVQFVKGLETLYSAGARVFVEVGPKKALHGFVEDVLASRHDDVVTLFTNHPKVADEVGVNQALCGLWAAGVGFAGPAVGSPAPATPSARTTDPAPGSPAPVTPAARPAGPITLPEAAVSDETITELGRLFAGVLEEGMRLYRGDSATARSDRGATAASRPVTSSATGRTQQSAPATGAPKPGAGLATTAPVVITGAALGIPGVERTFDDENVARILAGQNFIGSVPPEVRQQMVDMRITRIVKDAATGSGSFVTIDDPADVIKLAARHEPLDMPGQFAVEQARDEALDTTTRLAIGAGFDALRDAGIPLTLRYKTTTIGSQLPDSWGLPEALRDDTGVVFASAFPGLDRFAEAIEGYAFDRGRRENLAALQTVRRRMQDGTDGAEEADRLIAELTAEIEANPYHFDRRFLFRALAMGHSQFAELIGARGPNTQVNAACASTTQAISVAEDWIRSGRAKRVIVVSADDATAPHLLPWVTAGFLATGAAATDERVEDAATPFDRRRHGMIVGMGAAAFVVESAESARERGLCPIAEVLAAVTANSAFHGTRLDVEHIGGVMESLMVQAERRGVKRHEIARQTMFMSHETYTPARGGSASAEINALRHVFGEHADEVVITNTKGFTGHAMGAGIEDVVAIKALETGLVPPVPNYKEPDPDLGELNLSKGGHYDVEYALRLAAGFGSQIAMALLRRTPLPGGARRSPDGLGYAYRIVDRHAWQHWLNGLSGREGSTLEVDHRRLRITDAGPPAVPLTPATHVPVPYPGIAGSSPSLRGSSPIAPTIDYPKPFDHTAGAKATSTRSTSSPAPAVAPASPTHAITSPPASVPAVEPSAPAVVAAIPEVTGDAVLVKVTEIVAEMTGYPVDLLDPDLDLEADLGVDTVKQAEVFAAVREEYGVERDATLQLRDFPTLHHVAGWIRDKTGISAPPAPAAAAATDTTPVAPAPAPGDAVLAKVTEIVAEMTGYPVDLLDPDLDLEADLGVDTVKQAEVFAAVREEYGVERDATLQLRDFPTLHHVAGWIRDKTGISAPPAPAPAAATDTTPVAPAPASGDAVLVKVTEIVAEMTGYPVDLLDPDLDLEADLGVDTVKQAEVFAAVREEYGVERDATLQLRDFPTLHHVASWIRDKMGSGAAPADGAPHGAPTHTAAASHAPTMAMVQGDLGAVDALPRRIPLPVLRPAASDCLETGVTLEGARVLVMLDEGGVGRSLVGRLEQSGATVLVLDPGVATDDLTKSLETWLADGPITGVYWLPALDAEGDHTDLDLDGWTEALRRRVKTLYTTMRRLWDDSPFLVSATRLGGYHGYDADGATNPMGGAVTGFTKSYKKERPDALVKAVDFPASRKTAALADLLVEETLRDPGAVEVGRADGKRWGVAFAERPFPPLGEDGSAAGPDGMTLGRDSVVVVTGAAGSIVSAITADLAAASGGTFHLLDLTPEPDRDDPDLAAFATDREGLKATIAERMKAAGERPTPVAIEKELSRLERLASAAAALDAVESAGGTAHYHCVDLTDAEAVAAVGQRIAETSSTVDVLLHAAGLEISRNLPEKEPHEFDLVFDVKTSGWFTLWHALRDLEIGAAVVFSSVAGRFGNQGQTDYAAANDLLCKITSSLRHSRPATRALALDWTAWGGIGMATRGSIPRIMELAGVQMLPPEAGVAWIRRELTSGDFSGEVIVAGTLGMMAAEYAENGGLDSTRLLADRACGPMVGEVSSSVHRGIVVTTTLDPREQPFLDDHRIDGTAVLPGVMGMEAFAEVATLVAPTGYGVAAIEDVAFHAPVKFYRDQPRTLTVTALTQRDGDGEDLLVECALTAERRLPGQDSPVVTTHFTAVVRLSTAEAEEETIDPVGDPVGRELSPEDVYRLYFHGPAYQVVGSAWAADGASVARLAEGLPDNHSPADAPLVGAPRLAELGFQVAGLWEAGRDGRLALPRRVGALRVVPGPHEGPMYAVARQSAESTFDVWVVDTTGRVLVRLVDYVSIPLPAPIATEVGAPLAEVFGA